MNEAINWRGRKKINLALQGGGSHGAFTWGVLDEILRDGRLDIEAITGTSAGAMNGVALLQGYLEGGRDGARQRLEEFWRAICEDSALSSAQREMVDALFGAWTFEGSPFQAWLDFMSSLASPYSLNPLNINPLREVVENIIDFEKVRACAQMKLFIAATNVHTGHVAVFERENLTVEHLLASACLPQVFQAVEIDGVPYWDGGYMGNPALFPLFYESATPDILIVQVNPIERKMTPKSPRDIQNRLNEITFNGALLAELRAIDFVSRLIDEGKLHRATGAIGNLIRRGQHRHEAYMRPLVHRIDGADEIAGYSASSKFNTRWDFLTELRDVGRKAAAAWLERNFDRIGVEGTLDLRLAFN